MADKEEVPVSQLSVEGNPLSRSAKRRLKRKAKKELSEGTDNTENGVQTAQRLSRGGRGDRKGDKKDLQKGDGIEKKTADNKDKTDGKKEGEEDDKREEEDEEGEEEDQKNEEEEANDRTQMTAKFPSAVNVVSCSEFVAKCLHRYDGPQVKLRIGDDTGAYDHEYVLSKRALCAQSEYFMKLYTGGYKEGNTQIATLDSTLEFVTERSVEMLIQWLYTGRVDVGGDVPPQDEINAIVDFARLAEYCLVVGMEELMSERIKELVLDNPGPKDFGKLKNRHVDTNTFCITSEALVSAAYLEGAHRVKGMVVATVVEGLLRSDTHKFAGKVADEPRLAGEVLKAVTVTLHRLFRDENGINFPDPISGEVLRMWK